MTQKIELTKEQDEFLHKYANIVIDKDGNEEFQFTVQFKHKKDAASEFEVVYNPADYLKVKVLKEQQKEKLKKSLHPLDPNPPKPYPLEGE